MDACLERVRKKSLVDRHKALSLLDKQTPAQEALSMKTSKLSNYGTSSTGGSDINGDVKSSSDGTMKGVELVVDPMHDEGYINIRIKPPLNAKGIKVSPPFFSTTYYDCCRPTWTRHCWKNHILTSISLFLLYFM